MKRSSSDSLRAIDSVSDSDDHSDEESNVEWENVKKYFSPQKWSTMGAYQKERHLRLWRNYQKLVELGFPARQPEFMSQSTKAAASQTTSTPASTKKRPSKADTSASTVQQKNVSKAKSPAFGDMARRSSLRPSTISSRSLKDYSSSSDESNDASSDASSDASDAYEDEGSELEPEYGFEGGDSDSENLSDDQEGSKFDYSMEGCSNTGSQRLNDCAGFKNRVSPSIVDQQNVGVLNEAVVVNGYLLRPFRISLPRDTGLTLLGSKTAIAGSPKSGAPGSNITEKPGGVRGPDLTSTRTPGCAPVWKKRPQSCSRFAAKCLLQAAIRAEVKRRAGRKPLSLASASQKLLEIRELSAFQRRPVSMAPCRFCPARFGSFAAANDHELTHGKFRLKRCRKCNGQFAALKLHRRRCLRSALALYCRRIYRSKGLHKEAGLTTRRSTMPRTSGPHKCAICGKGFAAKHLLNHHARVHAENGSFKCQKCPARFYYKPQLDRHSKLHEEVAPDSKSGTRVLTCQKCNWPFETKRSHTYHTRRCGLPSVKLPDAIGEPPAKQTDPEGRMFFPCGGCGNKCGSLGEWRRHASMHLDTRSCKCRFCPGKFRTAAEVFTHEKRVHQSTQPENLLTCEYCQTNLQSKLALEQHLTDRCPTFAEKFPEEWKRRTVCVCRYCGKLLSGRESLDRHEQLHRGEKPNKCQLCPAEFTKRAHLDDHEKIHDGRPLLTCEGCGWKFGWLKILHRHLPRCEAANVSAQELKTCKTCDKTFPSIYWMKQHEKTKHNGEHPFKCRFCPRTFTQGTNQKNHEKATHAPGKPVFTCKDCGSQFPILSVFNAHRRRKCPMRPAPEEPERVILKGGKSHYACPHCTAVFDDHQVWEGHLKIHDGRDLLTCRGCKMQFARKNHFAKHEAKCRPEKKMKRVVIKKSIKKKK